MKIPLASGHVRIIVVIVFFCLAINVVLYTSALFTSSSTDHHQMHDANEVGKLVKERIFLRARGHHSAYKALGLNRAERGISPSNRDHEHQRRRSSSSKGSKRNGSLKRAAVQEQRTEDRNDDAPKPELTKKAAATSSTTVHHAAKKQAAAFSKSGDNFDIEKVLQLVQGCTSEDGSMSLDCYNEAYGELNKIFKALGTLFSFVISEISEKIGILREYQKSSNGEQFRTIQSMVQYEVSKDLTNQGNKPSACRTLLRLHRALQFISALLTKIRDVDDSRPFSEQATEAYDATLGKHHGWVIRQGVHVAMYGLPDRKNLLAKLNMEDTEDEMDNISSLIKHLDAIYDITQQLYAENHILDLP